MEKIKLPHIHNDKTLKLLERLPKNSTFDMISDTFALISDSSRVKILWMLCHTEECVVNIATVAEMSPPAVSHHLRILKDAEILAYRRDGKEAYYTLADTEKARFIHKIVDAVFDIHCSDKY